MNQPSGSHSCDFCIKLVIDPSCAVSSKGGLAALSFEVPFTLAELKSAADTACFISREILAKIAENEASAVGGNSVEVGTIDITVNTAAGDVADVRQANFAYRWEGEKRPKRKNRLSKFCNIFADAGKASH